MLLLDRGNDKKLLTLIGPIYGKCKKREFVTKLSEAFNTLRTVDAPGNQWDTCEVCDT